MNLFDIVITLCLIAAGIKGFFNGFIHQASSFISMILGIWVAYTFCGKVTSFLLQYFEISRAVLCVVAFAFLFIAVSLTVALIGKGLNKLIRLAMMGWLDRFLGLITGVVEAMLVILVLVIVFSTLADVLKYHEPLYLRKSLLYDDLKSLAFTVFPYFKDLIFH